MAAELAIQRPELVNRLVMPGIPYYPAEERERILGQYTKPRPFFSDPDYVGNSYRRNVLDADNPLEPSRRHELFVSQLLSATRSHFGFAAVRDYAADEQLKKIRQPVLLPILNETLAEPTRQAASLLREHTLIEMPAYDAWTWFVEPGAITRPVRQFLDDRRSETQDLDIQTLGTVTAQDTGAVKLGTRRWRHYARTRYGQMHFVSAEPERGQPTRPPLLLLHPSPMSGDIFFRSTDNAGC